MSSITLGIDISKDKFDVALLENERYQLGTFDNCKKGYQSLAKWLKKRQAQNAHVCIEATGRYGDAVVTFLHERGLCWRSLMRALLSGNSYTEAKNSEQGA